MIKTHDTGTGEIKGQNTEKNMGKETIQGPGLQSFYLDDEYRQPLRQFREKPERHYYKCV